MKRYVLDRLADGTFHPRIDRVFGFEEIADAYRYLESIQQVGKIVITNLADPPEKLLLAGAFRQGKVACEFLLEAGCGRTSLCSVTQRSRLVLQGQPDELRRVVIVFECIEHAVCLERYAPVCKGHTRVNPESP